MKLEILDRLGCQIKHAQLICGTPFVLLKKQKAEKLKIIEYRFALHNFASKNASMHAHTIHVNTTIEKPHP
jgi:hypothetical protein